MPKINREEYEVLKELNDKWKWIARDRDQQTYVYEYRPIKSKLRGKWESNWNDYYPLPRDWFQFIQWEDEEPHEIAELIEEYEEHEFYDYVGWEYYESEETEVNKQKLIEKWESAIEAAEFYGKGKEDRLIEYMRDFVSDLNQLDEPEVLSQEWISEHKHYYPVTAFNNSAKEIVDVEDLQTLLVPTLSEMETVEITEEQVMEWLDNNDFYCHATAETVLANAVDKGELGYYGTKYSVVKKEPETVADVVTTFWKSYERLKEVMSMEVEELEE